MNASAIESGERQFGFEVSDRGIVEKIIQKYDRMELDAWNLLKIN